MKKSNRKSTCNLSDELWKAINLHQNSKFNQAKIIYKNILKHVPAHPDALHMLGVLYSQTGKLDTAIDLMLKARKCATARPDLLFNLARAYHDKGELDHAVATYQQYLDLVPEDSEALHWMGRVLHDKKDLVQANAYYQRALEKSPERVDSLNSLGLIFQEQGYFKQAVVCFEQALKYQPNDFIVLNNLGETFWNLKKPDKAMSYFRQALSVKPDYAKVFNNIGIVLREEGMLEEAADSFKKAVIAESGYAEAHYNLGLVLGQQKMFTEAAGCFWKALSVNPEYAEAHYNLGLVIGAQKMFADAASCFRHALSVNPEYAEAHYNLGLVLAEQKMFAEAAGSFQQALSCKPEYSEAYCGLGYALYMQKMFNEAIDSLQMGLSIKPDFPQVYVLLGRIYLIQGDLNKALASCEKALAIEPDYLGGLLLMTCFQKGSMVNDIVLRQEKAFAKKDLENEQKSPLAFALGNAHADNDDYDKAFFYLSEGNRLKRESYEYSIEEDEHLFGLIKKVYSKHYISEHSNEGCTDETPIFILGMPRSGTSLVEQILASHPNVFGAGELEDFEQVAVELIGGHSLTELFEKIPQSGGDFYQLLATEYLQRLRSHSTSVKFITDKYPHNFLHIGAICLALPSAKIVHCVREPMDNCFSIYKNLFGGENKYTYDLRELGQYYRLYLDLMKYWHDLFPGRIYDIKYEDLIADQEAETRKLLHHCGLSWEEQCLSFYKTARNVSTLSWTQVRKPIYNSSIKLWEKYRKHLEPLRATIFAER